jgi:membrane-associated phospholipid phosphatase
LSVVFSAHKSTVADILAWLAYGILHFAMPFMVSLAIFIFSAPGTLPAFAKAFGYMNLVGVILQFSFPCSPPWYEEKYGRQPAYYGMGGDPAGLARIDALFGVDMYTTTFKKQPVPFGAFPSLHSGCATTEALFMAYVFPRLRIPIVLYVTWIYWSTLYLSHHYAVDLLGGAILAVTVYLISKKMFLPRQQPGKTFRWDYDYTELGSDGLDLEDMHSKYNGDEDWTLGSSSSFSSGSRSPSDETQSIWEGETLASHSDSDSVEVRVV